MIDPCILMHDLDEGGWSVLTAAAAAWDLTPADELHVLHEGGTVLAAVRTASGPLDELPTLGDDLPQSAARLRAEHGVDRVLLVDADDLAPVLAAERELAVAGKTQPELLHGLQAAFRVAPGVVADPPLDPPARWPELFARLGALGDGTVTLTAPGVRLLGRLAGGRLVEVTTLRGRSARVVLALDLGDGELERLLTAPDVAAALLARPELAPEEG